MIDPDPVGQSSSSSGPTPPLAIGTTDTESRSPGVPSKLRILIVEDDDLAGRALLRLLGWKGHRVEHVTDLAGAQAALLSKPDVVILDLMLPDGRGTTLLTQIRAAKIRARVIIMTGMSDRRELAEVLEAGADGIVIKPIDFTKLLSLL